MRIPILATCITALLCALSGDSGPRFDQANVESITKAIAELRTAFNAGDAAKAAAGYSSTGAVMPPNRPVMRGPQFVQQYCVDRSRREPDLEIEATDVSGQGTLAYAIGDFSLNFAPKEGGQNVGIGASSSRYSGSRMASG